MSLSQMIKCKIRIVVSRENDTKFMEMLLSSYLRILLSQMVICMQAHSHKAHDKARFGERPLHKTVNT